MQTAEGNRILVELPGITNLEDARRIIQETAFLEIVDGGATPPSEGELICTTLGCPRPEQLTPGPGYPHHSADSGFHRCCYRHPDD